MAFFTVRVEYALHTVLNIALATAANSPSARELAEFQRLPLAFTRRLLTQLDKAGLITGSEGVRGGWQLAQASEDITVLDVAEAAQGGSELFECRNIRARCALWPDDEPPRAATSGVCAIQAVMLAAEAAMRHELAACTIADLVGRVTAKGTRSSERAVPLWFADRYARRSGDQTDNEGRDDD